MPEARCYEKTPSFILGGEADKESNSPGGTSRGIVVITKRPSGALFEGIDPPVPEFYTRGFLIIARLPAWPL